MSRTVYINGEYVSEEQASISIFDRSVLFADAIYEVTAVLNGGLLGFDGHMARLQRSIDALDIDFDVDASTMLEIHKELVNRNNLVDGMIYLQLTRGSAGDRDFLFPVKGTKPTLFLFAQSKPGFANSQSAREGIKVCTVPDLRWDRRDIKTVQLLYPSMAKMEAVSRGFDDAWMVEHGHITEGTSNNAGIIIGKKLITRHLGHEILAGITRVAVLECAKALDLSVEERSFTVEEAYTADEAFITSSTMLVTPVVQLDDSKIGNGKVGPIVTQLREHYLNVAQKAAIKA